MAVIFYFSSQLSHSFLHLFEFVRSLLDMFTAAVYWLRKPTLVRLRGFKRTAPALTARNFQVN